MNIYPSVARFQSALRNELPVFWIAVAAAKTRRREIDDALMLRLCTEASMNMNMFYMAKWEVFLMNLRALEAELGLSSIRSIRWADMKQTYRH